MGDTSPRLVEAKAATNSPCKTDTLNYHAILSLVKLGEPLTSNIPEEQDWVSEKKCSGLLSVLAKSNPDWLSSYLSCSDVLAVHHFFKHLTCFALVVTGDQVVGVVHRCGVNSKPVYQP